MKKITISLLATFLTILAYSQETDSLKIIEIPASYANYEGPATMVKKDSLYVFRTSEIYLVNEMSFSALRRIYENAKDADKMTNRLLEDYSKTLKRNFELENKLKINFAESDSLDRMIYERTQATLKNTQKALDYTINSLEKATNSLDIVEKNNKRERRKSTFEKILFAIGGVGAGILVGVSL